MLPEQENHNPSAGAGQAPLEWGQQPSSLLASPCRWLAAAPADLDGSQPCPRHSRSTQCPHNHPGAAGKGSAFLQSFLRIPLARNFSTSIQIVWFCSGMASSVCCVCAELLCSLQLLTCLAPAEGFNKLSKYLYWAVFGALVWGTRCFRRTRDLKSISLMTLCRFSLFFVPAKG